ncbi:hypothetical protein OG778_29460 [Streptomyces sp. NBC_00184]|nr:MULTISPECIES: hypothetical protein [unclassified Streptomyces]
MPQVTATAARAPMTVSDNRSAVRAATESALVPTASSAIGVMATSASA